jgi:hypothetical protein
MKLKPFIKYILQYLEFYRLSNNASHRFAFRWQDRHICLDDDTEIAGFDPHYIYHPAWAARILARTRPDFHVDISSSLHFCTLVSAFIPVKFYDYRPADIHLSGLTTGTADLLALPFAEGSIQSLSCMHVVEHVGLGRYGDPLDPDGDLKAISELKRVLAVGGSLLFVVPIGQPKVVFNAHRIYSYEQIVSYFSEFDVKEFSLIADDPEDGLKQNATKEMAGAQIYGCGCFWFVRKTV